MTRIPRLRAVTRPLTALGLVLGLAGCGHDSAFSMFSSQAAEPPMAASEQSFLSLADSLAARGNHSAAIALYRRAHTRTPFDHRPLLGLGRSLMALGEYESAARALTRAWERDETNPHILSGLGASYLYLGKTGLAVRNFERAVATGSAPVDTYSGLGIARDLMGRHAEAQDAFDAGLAIYADNPVLLSNKALSLALAGASGEAITILDPLVRSARAEARDRQNLSLALAFEGRTQDALHLASIDAGHQAGAEIVQSYLGLAGMAPEDRVKAAFYGSAEPRHDLEQAANTAKSTPDGAQETAERILAEEPVPAPEPAPEPEAEKPDYEIPPMIEPEGWAVQIAAYRRPEEVMRGWHLLSEQYADIIGHLEPRRSEIDFGPERTEEGPEGFFYRLNAGPLSNFAEARAVCDALEAAGGDCWIRPPEPAEGRLPAAGGQDGAAAE